MAISQWPPPKQDVTIVGDTSSESKAERGAEDLFEQILTELKIMNAYNQVAFNEKLTEEDLEV